MERKKTFLETPVGWLKIEADNQYLLAIDFVNAPAEEAEENQVLALVKNQLVEYFAGERQRFDVPLKFIGTPFQVQVWKALQTIPYGQTQSYQFIARKIGRPKAVRAVGQANGKNPIPIIVPCHRVIGKNGAMVGYSSGLWRKQVLLDLERRFNKR